MKKIIASLFFIGFSIVLSSQNELAKTYNLMPWPKQIEESNEAQSDYIETFSKFPSSAMLGLFVPGSEQPHLERHRSWIVVSRLRGGWPHVVPARHPRVPIKQT